MENYVALHEQDGHRSSTAIDWEFDCKEALRSVLVHFGTEGAALVTGDVLAARKAKVLCNRCRGEGIYGDYDTGYHDCPHCKGLGEIGK